MRFSVVLPPKMFLIFLALFSFSFKAKAETCIDFTRDGIVPLIVLLEEKIQEDLLKINIKVNIANESIVETLSDAIWESTVSIIDALDEDSDRVQGDIEGSTLSIIDGINFLTDLEQLIKDRNLSKSGNIPRCPGGPFEITESGYYALEDNTNCCIVIKSSDVTVDLNDFTLFCTDDFVIKVNPNLKNIEIKNGKIKSDGTQDGIFFNDACELVSIENVKIFACDSGITFSGALNSEIKDCIIKDCDIESCNTGARLVYSKKCIFENCNAFSCASRGFFQEDSSFNVYENCIALNTGDTPPDQRGFASERGQKNLFVRCKAINTNGGFPVGFFMNNETGSKIVNCIANRSTGDAPFVAFGIVLGLASTGCVLEGNEVMNSSGLGIVVDQPVAEDNLLVRNISYNNVINYFPKITDGAPYIHNIYDYDHDTALGPRSPNLLDNLDIAGP